MVQASAWRGEHGGRVLIHTFKTSPQWSLAITAIALRFLEVDRFELDRSERQLSFVTRQYTSEQHNINVILFIFFEKSL